MKRNRKLIFFDIDGTLLKEGRELPISTQAAVRSAKENGNMVFLATGRSKGIVPGIILDLGFDGFVFGSGAYVEYKDKMLFHNVLDKGKVKELTQYLTQNHAHPMYETNEACYLTEETKKHIIQKVSKEEHWDGEMAQEFANQMRIEDDIDKIGEINKLIYFDFKGSISELSEAFADDFTILPNSIMPNQDLDSGEISQKGITKASGIEYILKYVGADREDVIAFGDSFNDLEMIQFAGTGVAMGNAVDDLKNVADMVAPDIDKDGIHVILERLGII